MIPRPRVRDYMTTKLILLQPDMGILQAVEILLEKRISGAPVVDKEGALVGVLSKKDCLRAALNAAYYQEWSRFVCDFMNPKVETMEADTDLVTAAEHFLASNFRRFPVVQDGRLVGQVSRADLLKALLENWC